MKKTLKILAKTVGGFLLFIFLLLLILPLFFKSPVMNRAKEELNKNLNARADFDQLSLSLITSFPNLAIKLKGLTVVGLNEFKDDTLVSLNSFRVSVNLMSLLSKKGYEIRSVIIDRPAISALVLESGKANWDIAKSDSTAVEAPPEETITDTTAATSEIKVQLKKFSIRHARIAYSDYSSNLEAFIGDLNFGLSGNLGTRSNQIQLSADAAPVTVKMDGIAMLKKVAFKMRAGINADLEKMFFSFNDNSFSLNDLTLLLNGNVDLSGDNPVMDIRFNTSETSFKSLISLIPSIYMNDYQDLKASGNLKLDGFARGTYVETDSIYPDIGLNLTVENAGFQYPALPKSVDHVDIDLKLFVKGDDPDKTTVDLNRFGLQVAGNPFSAAMHVRTPISDPAVKGSVNGKLNLSDFTDVMPMEEMKISGQISAAMNFDGAASSIEKEQYDAFNASGTFKLKDFEFAGAGFSSPLKIKQMNLLFTPAKLELSDFDGTMGKSDFQLEGILDNYLLFALKDEKLEGNFTLTSSLLDLNEMIPETGEENDTIVTDTTALAIVKVPGNIDFLFSSRLKKVRYGELDLDNLQGKIRVKESRIYLEGLQMNLLKGGLEANGLYDVSDTLKPNVSMDMGLNNMDIPSAFNSFNTVQALVPFAKNLNGTFSMNMNYKSLLGSDMMPVIPTTEASGRFKSKEITIVSSAVFDQIKNLLKLDPAYTNTMKDVNIGFTIRDGKVQVEPFDVKMGNIEANISGEHGLDQSLNYLVKTKIPRKDLGTGANALFDNLASQAAAHGINLAMSDPVPLNFKITGRIGHPKVAPAMGASTGSSGVKEVVKQEIKARVEEQTEKVKEEVRDKASEEAEKILTRAEKEAGHLKQVARETSEKIRTQGYAQADSLESKAKDQGFLAKSIAKKAAEKLRQETDKKADAIVREADEKAARIMEEARKKADGLKNE